VRFTPTRQHVITLATNSSRRSPEVLTVREVLAHSPTVFHPYTYGLHRGVVAVAAALIGYDDLGLLPQRPRGGDDRDRLLPIYRCMTTLDCCSSSFSAALRV
jgi:hypothetical protein